MKLQIIVAGMALMLGTTAFAEMEKSTTTTNVVTSHHTHMYHHHHMMHHHYRHHHHMHHHMMQPGTKVTVKKEMMHETVSS